MKTSMNTTVTMHGNVVQDIRIAKQAGFAGIALQDPHVYRYLDVGLPVGRLLQELEGIEVSAVGCLHNISTVNRPDGPFLAAVDTMCSIAKEWGAKAAKIAAGYGLKIFLEPYL